jgi:hypothetical protein
MIHVHAGCGDTLRAVPQVMSLSKSRERAERVFVARELRGLSWSRCRDEFGFTSIGAVQQAYNRCLQRNPLPGAESVRAGILARKQHCIGVALESLAAAAADGDHAAVARLVDTVTKCDSELAKLYGLSRETLDVAVQVSASQVIDDAETKLLALVGRGEPRVIDGPALRWTDQEALTP